MGTRVRGVLLAAGAGRRMGRPKALVDDWLVRGVTALRDGGCGGVTVVLGAAADEARALLDDTGVNADRDDLQIVEADDWAEGMGASLRAGLDSLTSGDAALVHLVDLPDVGADVVRRVLAAPIDDRVLRRASYDGKPGHPVLIGRAHWAGVRESAQGDQGARAYLAAHDVELVDCGDLATGRDIDSRDTP